MAIAREFFGAENIKKNNEVQRELQKKKGLEELNKVGIDPEEYRPYFDILRRSDVPLKQALPDPELFAGGILSAKEIKEIWNRAKEGYDRIDLDEQTEETGREIIKKMKELVDRYTTLLDAYVEDPRWNKEEIVPPSEELLAVRSEMLEHANEFNNLPAYLSYRKYGMFEIDPDSISQNEYFRNRRDI